MEAKIAKKISGLLQKNHVYLELEKKYATALQDGLAGYNKAVCYYCFAFFTRTVPMLN